MLENAKKAMQRFHESMEKAEAERNDALASLKKDFEIKSTKTGGYYVPQKTKGTKAYNDRYVAILNDYENVVMESKEACRADAEAALAKAKADIIIFTQKAPADSVMNSIAALEGVGANHITKEEVLMLMESNKTYLGCKKLAQIAEDAELDVFIYTLADALDVLYVARKDVEWFFNYYSPDSYRTLATLGDKSSFANADRFLDAFMAGNFVKGNAHSWIDEVREAKKIDAAEKKKTEEERKASEAEIEAKANQMTEAEKLALYLN
ncbi:MAG: hypothetical protein K6B42_08225 [Clostridia bacterium]|nr:hypothetical protein [Clostridia bacterium]